MADSPELPGTFFDLIRHGEPEGGRKYRGLIDDPLSDQGWQQMQAQVFESDQWDAVLTSPLKRCADFAASVAEARGLPLYEEPDLREMSFGDWDGYTPDAIARETPEALKAFWRDPVNCPPPGGENIATFYRRVEGAMVHWREELQGQRTLLVGHGGVIRMILATVMATPLEKAMGAVSVPFACRSRIRMDRIAETREWLSCLVAHHPGNP